MAQARYEVNRRRCHRPLKFDHCQAFLAFFSQRFQDDGWTDTVVGRARLTGEFTPDEMVSTAALYTHIDQQRLEICNIDLTAKTKRRNTKHATVKHKRILGRSIDERPVAANMCREFGHFEIDTVVGKRNGHESVVLTLIERQTRMAILRTHR